MIPGQDFATVGYLLDLDLGNRIEDIQVIESDESNLRQRRADAEQCPANIVRDSPMSPEDIRESPISPDISIRGSPISPEPSTSDDHRIEDLQKKVDGMFSALLKTLGNGATKPSENFAVSDDSASEDETSTAPTIEPSQNAPRKELDIDFTPHVQISAPPVPPPDPVIKEQGIECQRLNSDGWNRVRYKDVEKELHASPVFSALKVNVQLTILPNQPPVELLRQEKTLGTITHGLLLQRKALLKGLKEVGMKCPQARQPLSDMLQNSEFQTVTQNLLQYVCGRRADTIEMRRKYFKASNSILNTALHDINPSTTHLFEEEKLQTFLTDNGGLANVFGLEADESSSDHDARPRARSKFSKHSGRVQKSRRNRRTRNNRT